MAERPVLGLRIGESVSPVRGRQYFDELLTQEQERRLVDIDGINRDLVRAVGVEIPTEFLLDTGLVDLKWEQIYHPNALSAVYFGVKEKQASRINLPDSEAIIAINSFVNEGQIVPGNVGISCVVPDSQGRKRVLSVLYDVFDDFTALDGCVSIAGDEKSEFPFYVHPDDPRDEEARLVRIPSLINDFLGYRLPGREPLVSLKMSQLAQGDARMVRASATDKQHLYILSRDFIHESDGNNRVIGRRETSNKPSWKVSYPASLTPVKTK